MNRTLAIPGDLRCWPPGRHGAARRDAGVAASRWMTRDRSTARTRALSRTGYQVPFEAAAGSDKAPSVKF